MADSGNVCGQFPAGGDTFAGIAHCLLWPGRWSSGGVPLIRCGGSPSAFAGGGIGTSSGGHQLPLSAGGRSPASFHGILQGSTGSGICSAFADLVGFFHAGGGYLFSGSISEYLPEYAGRTKERGQRAVRDGGGIPPSLGTQFFYIYRPALKPFLLSAFQLSLGMCWKSGVAAEVIGTPSHSIGGALYLAKIYLDTADLFAWTAVIVVLSVFLKK